MPPQLYLWAMLRVLTPSTGFIVMGSNDLRRCHRWPTTTALSPVKLTENIVSDHPPEINFKLQPPSVGAAELSVGYLILLKCALSVFVKLGPPQAPTSPGGRLRNFWSGSQGDDDGQLELLVVGSCLRSMQEQRAAGDANRCEVEATACVGRADGHVETEGVHPLVDRGRIKVVQAECRGVQGNDDVEGMRMNLDSG
ncbi:hypothetical protein GGX14DRAFT_384101 [Mycena pura]|uniref:Uncharacterized protein n=1 Tax=Mycena pura TaxID=153505 RepID=A0AAD6YUQ8_9AGAR|nr:hypothetical protein GGX14DRAFT_384101 [Mycena pura]